MKVTGGVKAHVFAARATGKKETQASGEKAEVQGGAVIPSDSKRRMNAACCGVRSSFDTSLLHHSRDSLWARFIPASLFGHVERIASRVSRPGFIPASTEGVDSDLANVQTICGLALSKWAKPRRNKTICAPVS
jgi:hypothetical protein